ncbi:hypothetical protein [Pelagibacterium montanilacus]|uniref:hypothetical protein n=1 Tax=Pelagibacterium montanilacus TaxID=2185280 RepID=UPI000F8CE9EC|nr:hypothetical protein [Pelagibacterium montanilacus]
MSLPRYARMRAARRAAQSTLAAMDRPVSGQLILRPNEDHWVRISVNGIEVLIHRAQMDRLEALFGAARREIEADEYRSGDRLRMHTVQLGGF